MKTLVIGFVDDAISPFLKGIAIRISYLLSTEIRTAGNLSNYALADDPPDDISIEQKLKFINKHEKDNPDAIQFYQHYKEFQKIYKKDRGKNKELIVLQKKTEKKINEMFSIVLQGIRGILKTAGLGDYKALADSKDYAEYYIRYKDAESENNEDNKLSDVLQLQLDEDDNDPSPIIMLTDIFFSPEFILGTDEMPILNTLSEQGFLQELFPFPNYNDISIADLNTIRFSVNDSLINFQQSVRSFAALHTNPTKAFEYLQSSTLVTAKALTESINKTGLMANYNKLVGTERNLGKLYLGMLPRHLVFKYFEFIKVSQAATIAVLQQLPDEYGQQLMPIFITRVDEAYFAGEVETDNAKATLMPLKKSLIID